MLRNLFKPNSMKNIEILCSNALSEWALIARSINSAKEAASINRIIVSTDDVDFAQLAKQNGAEVPFLRPSDLARDDSSIVDVVRHLCESILNSEKRLPSALVLIQPTSPFVTGSDIDDAYSKLTINVDAVASVCESEVYPDWLRKCNQDGWLVPISHLEIPQHSPRQKMDKVIRINGAIYWVRTKVFLDKLTFLPEKTAPFEMPGIRSIDIDNAIDLALANLIAKNGTDLLKNG